MSDSDEEYENNRASPEEEVGRSISETFISSSKLC